MTHAADTDRQDLAVAMPADVDQPDRIVAGLTTRQASIVAVAAAVLWGLRSVAGDSIPLPVFAGVALVVMAAAVTVALGRRDGMSLDRWLLAAARHAAAPRRHVGAVATAAAAGAGRGAPVSLASPVAAVDDDGVIDLGGDGQVVLLVCEPVNFSLRSPSEQAALVAALARWLHAASTPVQILVRCAPADLSGVVEQLLSAAPGLPHPALEAAAAGHAEFLQELAADREVLHRDVLVVVRDTNGQVTRRAAEAASTLSAAEVRARRLTGREAAAAIAACADPYAPGAADGHGPLFGGVVTGAAMPERSQ